MLCTPVRTTYWTFTVINGDVHGDWNKETKKKVRVREVGMSLLFPRTRGSV
jgi:hypothetical protein